MADSADPVDLGPVSRALRGRPGFLSGWLSATPDAERILEEDLHLDPESIQRLLLCRAPRPQRFAEDVLAIADYVGVPARDLAVGLRKAASLGALKMGGPSLPSALGHAASDPQAGLLAAARDTAIEQVPRQQNVDRLRRLAEATWRAAPEQVFIDRDVEAALAWSSRLAVITLPHLRLDAVNEWLEARGAAPLATESTAKLKGLLVAWRGHGIIFVDGTLDASERRLTLGHEHGHFLLDYAEPRRQALSDAPSLVEVIDGDRPPTAADHARAALSRVPLGVHTHLLDRHTDGEEASTSARVEDDATLYALELMTPWDELLTVVRALPSTHQPYPELLEQAASAVARTFNVPVGAARSRASDALAAIGIRPGFFDR